MAAVFAVGEAVELAGLSKAQLNGARGTVLGFDADKGRYSVRLVGAAGPQSVLGVKPLNLVRALSPLSPSPASTPPLEEDEEEAAEHARWLAALPTMTPHNLGEELLEAARYGEVREVGELLEAGAAIDYTDVGGNTALHRASANGHAAVVRLLASKGARLLSNEAGNLPLHWAVQQGDPTLVKTLLDAYPDADVLAKNEFGKSVSTEAFARNIPEIVDAVLAHSSAARLDPEENPSSADAFTAEVTHEFHFAKAYGSGGSNNDCRGELSPLCCREINSIGGDDPTAVIGANANEDRTGLQIWSASLILARWVSGELAPSLHGASVCELGAGCALPSIAAAVHAGAAFVLATDLALPTMQNMEHNLTLNNLSPSVARAAVVDWGDRGTWPSPPDVLLGSDLVYSREAVPQLLGLVDALVPGSGIFHYVAPETNRLGEHDFLDGLLGLGFSRREQPVPDIYLTNVMADTSDEDFGQIFPELATRTYTLYTFRREGVALRVASHATLAECVPIIGFAMAATAAVRQAGRGEQLPWAARPGTAACCTGGEAQSVRVKVMALGARRVHTRLSVQDT